MNPSLLPKRQIAANCQLVEGSGLFLDQLSEVMRSISLRHCELPDRFSWGDS